MKSSRYKVKNFSSHQTWGVGYSKEKESEAIVGKGSPSSMSSLNHSYTASDCITASIADVKVSLIK